jgi:hypothetical protein
VKGKVDPHDLPQRHRLALELEIVEREKRRPLRRHRPERLEVVPMGQEQALSRVGHEIEIGVGEVEGELPSREPSVRGFPGDVVEEQVSVVRLGLLAISMRDHVGKKESVAGAAIVDDSRDGALERPRKLALPQAVDHVHLVLDGVPDVEVVVPRHVDDLPSEAVFGETAEEASCLAVGIGVARGREIEDVAEEDEVVHLPHRPRQRLVGGPDGRLFFPGSRGDEGAERITEVGVGEDGDPHRPSE